MAKHPHPTWAETPTENDYHAANAFLQLLATPDQAEVLTALLSQAPTTLRRAGDVLRAAQLPLLRADDPVIAKQLNKASKGAPLSPILLIHGSLEPARPLQIADGYLRVCVSYHLSQDTDIPCRLVSLPAISRASPQR